MLDEVKNKAASWLETRPDIVSRYDPLNANNTSINTVPSDNNNTTVPIIPVPPNQFQSIARLSLTDLQRVVDIIREQPQHQPMNDQEI
jgi:hypothetical protein